MKQEHISIVFENCTKPNNNGRIYSQECIEKMMKKYKIYCKKDNFGEVFHPDRYTFGVDLAEGVDYTSIVVFDRKPKCFEWVTTTTLGDNIEISWQITN